MLRSLDHQDAGILRGKAQGCKGTAIKGLRSGNHLQIVKGNQGAVPHGYLAALKSLLGVSGVRRDQLSSWG